MKKNNSKISKFTKALVADGEVSYITFHQLANRKKIEGVERRSFLHHFTEGMWRNGR